MVPEPETISEDYQQNSKSPTFNAPENVLDKEEQFGSVEICAHCGQVKQEPTVSTFSQTWAKKLFGCSPTTDEAEDGHNDDDMKTQGPSVICAPTEETSPITVQEPVESEIGQPSGFSENAFRELEARCEALEKELQSKDREIFRAKDRAKENYDILSTNVPVKLSSESAKAQNGGRDR